MKKQNNLKITYEDEKLALIWKYTITQHRFKSKIKEDTIQHLTNLNTHIIKLTKIRKVLFIYKNQKTGHYHLTSTEPPVEQEYYTVMTRSNKVQTTIQLPKELPLLNDNTKQELAVKIYPHEKDPITQTKPQTILIIKDKEYQTVQPELKLIPEQTVIWIIKPTQQIPEDMQQFLTTEQIQEIQNNYNSTKITLNIITQQITIQTEDIEQ